MKATIYHNPMCGTSRKTLDILRDAGCDVWIHEYMKQPPSREELVRLYQRAGISPREGLRAKEELAEQLGLNRPDLTDDEVLDAMVAHPILINRPLVETRELFEQPTPPARQCRGYGARDRGTLGRLHATFCGGAAGATSSSTRTGNTIAFMPPNCSRRWSW